ncbi:MAG TPA: UvrD-helicase domain-containing protein [Gemmatimonadales bacterium]|jgi:superfamily I DNA/RNA helicase
MTPEETELRAAVERILKSPSQRKLVVAGPGTGKTRVFKELLKVSSGGRDDHLVLTFINTLCNDLEEQLQDLAQVSTLHGYCLGLLHNTPELLGGLSARFKCVPGLATLIKADWEYLNGPVAPPFVGLMRALGDETQIAPYLERGNYYDAVDFDDIVYRAHSGLSDHADAIPTFQLVLIDEYQDFNTLEAGFIEVLARHSPILIAGDDDQALYENLRNSSTKHIRQLYRGGVYEVFELPFCMRCPKVIVDAVNDVIKRAEELRKLNGRIRKPYKHFPLVKGDDSKRYPTIAVVATSVQSSRANYLGKYIDRAIAAIPSDEIAEAVKEGFPPVLVIVAKPYRAQIIAYLTKQGFLVDTRRDATVSLKRDTGLHLLAEDHASNVGWRIVLASEPQLFVSGIIAATEDGTPIVNALPTDYRQRILDEVAALATAPEPEAPPAEEVPMERVPVRVTSFEGAKGLSAQHVFIAGLHAHEIPRNAADPHDLEICKFVVGLTRTRKKCSLLYTKRFANKPRQPSVFLTWIDGSRLERTTVDARYWKKSL